MLDRPGPTIGRDLLVAALFAAIATPAAAQQQPGQVARSSVGETGQRQDAEQVLDVEPTARLDSRVQNRVQSRIRNRIDRYYDPRANAASPFAVADEQARTAGKPRRR